MFPDEDGDGIEDSVDNCPNDSNAGQADADSDGSGMCAIAVPLLSAVKTAPYQK